MEPADGTRGDLAQQSFEFAVRQLDGIEIRRVFWQVANRRMRALDRLRYAGNLVGLEVIHHDNVVAPERRNQDLLDVDFSNYEPAGADWAGVAGQLPRTPDLAPRPGPLLASMVPLVPSLDEPRPSRPAIYVGFGSP